jgi:hypothetical protein
MTISRHRAARYLAATSLPRLARRRALPIPRTARIPIGFPPAVRTDAMARGAARRPCRA